MTQNKKTPKFIKKLNQILESPSFSQIVSWLPGGIGFKIINTSRFTQEVLPKFYKHRNMASFIRQLNMYGFTRDKSAGDNVYKHPKFKQVNLNSIRQIARKETIKRKEKEYSDSQKSDYEDRETDTQMSLFLNKILKQNERLKVENEQLAQKIKFFTHNSLSINQSPSLSESTNLNELAELKTKQSFDCFQHSASQEPKEMNKIKSSFNFNRIQDGFNFLSYMQLIEGAKVQ